MMPNARTRGLIQDMVTGGLSWQKNYAVPSLNYLMKSLIFYIPHVAFIQMDTPTVTLRCRPAGMQIDLILGE